MTDFPQLSNEEMIDRLNAFAARPEFQALMKEADDVGLALHLRVKPSMTFVPDPAFDRVRERIAGRNVVKVTPIPS